MNLTKRQIDIIREHTPKEYIGKQVHLSVELGTYTRQGANWSYRAGYIDNDILVVTRFGEVIG